MGWLRLLSDWVVLGSCTGTDVAAGLLGHARSLVTEESLGNVTLVEDDLFHSRLPAGSFDLVHARFQLAPLGRAAEQLTASAELLRPGESRAGGPRTAPRGPTRRRHRGRQS